MKQNNLYKASIKEFETLSDPPAEFSKRAEIEESTDDGIPMSTLTITKSQLADRKVYICQVKDQTLIRPPGQ